MLLRQSPATTTTTAAARQRPSAATTASTHARRTHARRRRCAATGGDGNGTPHQQQQDQQQQRSSAAAGGKSDKELGLGLKAAWFGAELFGNVAAVVKGGQQPKEASAGGSAAGASAGSAAPARDVPSIVAAIRTDYDADYFISGAAAMDAYADDCEFSDDFAAFGGPGATARFKRNVANLGALLSDVKIDVESDWAVVDNRLTTQWRFQGVVRGLPWRPLLAAAGSTTHVIDPARGAVVAHEERWRADPREVVARLLRPARTPPGTAWETFMLALSCGDAKGMWMVLSARAITASALVLAAALVSRLVTGGGLPGGLGAALEVASAALLPAALITEVAKFAQGMQGGETGTGGRF